MDDSNAMPNAFDWTVQRGDKWRGQLRRMEAMLAPLDAPLLTALRLEAPMRIADVGCGGGGTTLEIARAAAPGSRVVGVDISSTLIDAARERAALESSPATFATVDVATAPPPDGPFERLVSRFGVMFFEQPLAAFENLATWLAPKGRFVFVVWGLPTMNPCFGVVRRVVSQYVELPPQKPDAPGPFRYGEVESLLWLLARAGFGNLHVSRWRGDLAIGGGLAPAEAADFVLGAFSVADPVEHADEATRAKVRAALSDGFAQHVQDGIVRLGACAHLVTGTRQ